MYSFQQFSAICCNTDTMSQWFCNRKVAGLQGRVTVSLQNLKQQGVVKDRVALQDGKSDQGRLDFEMAWSSYLGIDSIEKQKSEQHGPDS